MSAIIGSTLDYFVNKFNLDLNQPSPIQLPGVDRVGMAQIFVELGFKICAEIGVFYGKHAELLLQNIPGLFYFGIDPWNHYTYYKRATEKLSKYNCILKRKSSMEALSDFEDNSLDFVYIDAAHDFCNVAADISEWIKKVKPGGVLYGHDFVTIPFGNDQCHVKDVVTAYANSHLIEHWFYYGVLQEPRLDGRFSNIPEWMFIC